MDSIIYIVLGMLFANGVPHFVKGITAEKWDVPWKKPASASTNVLWGIANWLVVVILYALFKPDVNSFDAACFLIGMGITGYYLALHWSEKTNENDAA